MKRQREAEAGGSRARIAILTNNESYVCVQNLMSKLEACGARFDVLDACSLADVEPREYAVIVNRVSDCGNGDPSLVKFTHAFLSCATLRGVRVINGSTAYGICMSKLCQHALIESEGLHTPKSHCVRSAERLSEASEGLEFPVLLKPNSAGSGSGMKRFDSHEELRHFRPSANASALGPDEMALLQEFKATADGCIFRAFVLDGRVQCATKVQLADANNWNACMCNLAKPGVGTVTACVLPQSVEQQVIGIMRRCEADLGSVEFLVEPKSGDYLFFDVNL